MPKMSNSTRLIKATSYINGALQYLDSIDVWNRREYKAKSRREQNIFITNTIKLYLRNARTLLKRAEP